MRYDDVTSALIDSYGDEFAKLRDGYDKQPWKVIERAAFLERLRADGARKLIEIGAGTGQDSAFFATAGLDVTATDLSPAMVDLCRRKGLDAHVVDVLSLDFAPATFDAAFSMNCLLHVPNADLGSALAKIAALLRPGGLFFLGLYGDADSEGTHEDDDHVPKRFFAHRSDETITNFVRESFEIEDFHTVPTEHHTFQALTLRRPPS